MAYQRLLSWCVSGVTRAVVIASMILMVCGLVSSTPAAAAKSHDVAEPLPTSLSAENLSIVDTVTNEDLTFSATLTLKGTSTPVPDEDILFYLHEPFPPPGPFPGVACDAMTNAQGVASCSTYLTQIIYTLDPLGYSASFLGNSRYLWATAQAYYAVSNRPVLTNRPAHTHSR
jgi:hypothetical protein